MRNPSFLSVKNLIIAALTLICAVLLLVCTVAVQKLQTVYVDYRHYRALPVGVSAASNTNPVANTIVLFGDSRVQMWKPAPGAPGRVIINAGIAGETTTEMRRRFERDVLRLKPQQVVIQAGMNDLTAWATRNIPSADAHRERLLENMAYFVATLTDNNVSVVLTSVIPNTELNALRKIFWRPALRQAVDDTNRQLQQLAASYQADWLDVSPLFVDDNNRVRSELYVDTLHITSEAYTQINRQLEPLL
jgi:lysophospholipase L1-like esterase